jgi:class 3 adenylate cyclase
VELPGNLPMIWGQPELVVEAVEEFLIGANPNVELTRVLATVLFTDIVDSTGEAERLGDRRWRALLDVHDELAGRLVEQWGGRLVKTTGDGVLGTFDGPGRAIGCAGRAAGRAGRHRRPDPRRAAHRRGRTS